jgi:hypothetical protein
VIPKYTWIKVTGTICFKYEQGRGMKLFLKERGWGRQHFSATGKKMRIQKWKIATRYLF